MDQFSKIDLFHGLDGASDRKTCELFWQFGSEKFKLSGRLVAPQINEQSAPA
jgi:hypothetical protein